MAEWAGLGCVASGGFLVGVKKGKKITLFLEPFLAYLLLLCSLSWEDEV